MKQVVVPQETDLNEATLTLVKKPTALETSQEKVRELNNALSLLQSPNRVSCYLQPAGVGEQGCPVEEIHIKISPTGTQWKSGREIRKQVPCSGPWEASPHGPQHHALVLSFAWCSSNQTGSQEKTSLSFWS